MKHYFFLTSILTGLLLTALTTSSLSAAGITLVTHGNQPGEEYPEWVEFMADVIGSENISGSWSRYKIIIDDPGWDELRATVVHSGAAPTAADSGEIVIELDWSQVAGGLLIPDYPTADIAEKVVECLTSPDFFPGLGKPAVELPIHLAGHSRGGVLVAQIAELLGQYGIWVGQVTTLDPVPLSKDTRAGSFPMRLRENVVFADNYIQTLTPFITGSRLEGSYPRPAWDDSSDLADGYSSAHSDVHLWYHGTIDLNTPTVDGTGPDAQTITSSMRSSTGWWSPPEAQGAQAGFYYSRILGGTYIGGTRSAIGYTPPTNPFREPWIITATGSDVWDNVEITALTPETTIFPGDTIQLNTWFYDLNNDAVITWGIDPDNQNPYRSTDRIALDSIAASALPFGAGESLTTPRNVSRTLSTTGVLPGSYFAYAQISNGTTTRYYYFDSNGTGRLNIDCNDNFDCNDDLFCNGVETCADGVCISSGDPCAGGLLPVCSEDQETCIECSNNNDCDDGQFCTGIETCTDGTCLSPGDPCAEVSLLCSETEDSCVGCSNNDDCDDGLFCTGVETCTDGTCILAGDPCEGGPLPLCNESNNSCVECLANTDCADLYACENSVCVSACTLSITYKPLRSEKLKKPKKLKLTITGGQDFDPYGAVEVGPFEILKTKVKIKKNTLKIKTRVPAWYPRGAVPVRVGSCVGEVEIR